ncbi:MAG: peroxide stress protein YaaA [Lutibacter sp.]
MKILISPAKSLNFEDPAPIKEFTQCEFLDQSEKLNKVLRKKSIKKLSDLMHISKNLGELNYLRNQNWSLPFDLSNAKQAVYAFNGDVYVGLEATTIPSDKIDFMQNNLRILSGLYGLLKPLDLIQPYRLEMGTSLKVRTKNNLYQFWKNSLTQVLNNELDDDEPVINLASNEYFKAIQPKQIKTEVITPVFKDYKNGTLKTIGFFAKKARGLMTRYIINREIKNAEDLKAFNTEGYRFDANLSSATKWVFTR